MDWKKAEQKLNFLDRLEGDKVVWIILLFLSLISLVAIFSSTSQMATDNLTRLDIVRGQIYTIIGGLATALACYHIRSMRFYRIGSSLGFAGSLVLLLLLASHISTPIISACSFNGAWRALKIKGLQIHVFEVVKVAMVLYLAWAIDTMKKGKLGLVNLFKDTPHMGWLQKEFWQEVIYIFLPMMIVCVLVLTGGTSSALFVGAVMFLTIWIGGVPFKHIMLLGAVAIGVLLGCIGMYKATSSMEHPMFERLGTAFSRVGGPDYEEVFLDPASNAKQKQNALDKLRQPYGAKIAISEGGIVGKGAGESTQKYVVPVIYEDYIFSFIVEEYGMLGAILVIMLYISLLARGSLIARNCEEDFEKVAVAGLCILITAQGMFHIVINCDMGILTGQTLPLVSHGTSSFLCFSLAFGVILAVSRISTKRIQKEAEDAAPLLEATGDEIRDGMDVLDAYEGGEDFNKGLEAMEAMQQLEEMDL